MLVVDGGVQVAAGGESIEAGAGHARALRARRAPLGLVSDDGARLLLLLAPWPGEGHYRGSD